MTNRELVDRVMLAIAAGVDFTTSDAELQQLVTLAEQGLRLGQVVQRSAIALRVAGRELLLAEKEFTHDPKESVP